MKKYNKTKILRGGSWINYRNYARCADRIRIDPIVRINDIGFRCVKLIKKVDNEKV